MFSVFYKTSTHCCQSTLWYRLFPECGWHIRATSLKRTGIPCPNSHQFPIATQLWWKFITPPPSMLGFCQNWAGPGLVHAFTTPVSWFMQLPRCGQKALLLSSSTLSHSYNLFPYLFRDDPWALVGVGVMWMSHSGLSTHLLFSAHWPVEGACVNHCLLQEDTSLMRIKRCTNLWYEILHPSGRMISRRLSPRAYLSTGCWPW